MDTGRESSLFSQWDFQRHPLFPCHRRRINLLNTFEWQKMQIDVYVVRMEQVFQAVHEYSGICITDELPSYVLLQRFRWLPETLQKHLHLNRSIPNPLFSPSSGFRKGGEVLSGAQDSGEEAHWGNKGAPASLPTRLEETNAMPEDLRRTNCFPPSQSCLQHPEIVLRNSLFFWSLVSLDTPLRKLGPIS